MSYGYICGSTQPDEIIQMGRGRAIAGAPIGILLLDVWFPYMPGNVANASTWDFPVLYKILKGTTISMIFSADPALKSMIVEGGKELAQQGTRAIIGACGYFGHFQKEVAAALDIPVYLSSLLQVPMVTMGLKTDQKVGIICASQESLNDRIFDACGIKDHTRLLIASAQDLPEFRHIIECSGAFNSRKLELEMVNLAKKFVADNPDIGAILLECSDMPPYAYAIQNAVRLPVFDFTTLVNWVFGGVVRHPITGMI